MLTRRPTRNPSTEQGVALLISLFALLLISGVAVSLIVMSGTESAIAGNSKANTQAFYAAYAGLEEARGRMWPGHPNTLDAVAGINKGNTVMALNQVRYILNPSVGEVVSPTNLALNNPYADLEYTKEFGQAVTAAVVLTTTSTNLLASVAGLPGPLYKWVRITAKSEKSAGIDTNGDNVLNNTTPLFYDGTNQNLTLTGRQVLRATSLAVMPNGSRRMLQYDIAPIIFNLSFPSALTFDGYGDALFPPNSNVYWVNGNDNAGCGGAGNVQPARPAIGVPDNVDVNSVTKDLPTNRLDHYIGGDINGNPAPSPDVQNVSSIMPKDLQTVDSLENLLTSIQQNATDVIQGPVSTLPNFGSPSNTVIEYVNGDLTLSGTTTGYGILVVTGTYTAGGNNGWRGIVLVVGQGKMVVSGGGNNEYDGAVLLAKTRDSNGKLLKSLGSTYLDWSGGGGNGVYYSSGCIGASQNSLSYRVLSFREIAE
jgi:hypothetical protein